ncbi:hypothetical protein [Acidianus brierleyi]|uniref:hypothetical protein n=1 Tax=Acidianus brierleyi TaxID=41673 RepID=UPI00144353A1|nr:hypothetical protein [Acidianus brierleyi]AWR94856.2 hypothetical protein DFR85_09845 [Acidianus brierleyi]
MESFIKDPNPEEGLKLIESLYNEKSLCVKIPYTPDSIIFSSLLMKYFNGDFAISFSSLNCEVQLLQNEQGKWINSNDKQVFLGNSAFSSILPLSKDDLLPILSGISISSFLERRKTSEWENKIIEKAKAMGVTVEKNVKIPAYNELPLFLSLMLSFDPYLPQITGNRENAINFIKELGVNETTKLSELNETQLNTFLYKIMTIAIKLNPRISRDDIISDRIFYFNYDLLEVSLALIYFMDIIGSKYLIQFSLNPSIIGILIDKFRENVAKGFKIDILDNKGKYYIVDSELKSPTLISIFLQQIEKNKIIKTIVIKDNDTYLTSRYFLSSEEEGLIKIDIKDKN